MSASTSSVRALRLRVSRRRRGRGIPVELGPLVGLLALILAFSLLSDKFLTTSNLALIAEQGAIFAIMAVGMTFVLASGEIDLSVGAIYGLASVMLAIALRDGASPVVAVLIALAVGAIAGSLNGALSVGLGVPTIVITLGTLTVFRGVTYWITDGGFPVEGFPQESWFFSLADGKLLGTVPYIVLVMAAVAVLGSVVLTRTRMGRRTLATGSNRKAATYSAIRVNRVKIGVLTGMGLLAGLAGVLGLLTVPSGDPNAGLGYELDVIAAAIIGGVKLGGGAGSVVGAVIGTYIITTFRNGLVLLGVPIFANQIVSGAIVILAVAIDRVIRARAGQVRD